MIIKESSEKRKLGKKEMKDKQAGPSKPRQEQRPHSLTRNSGKRQLNHSNKELKNQKLKLN